MLISFANVVRVIHLTTQPFDISVVICTYTFERWNDLLSAVRSVQRQVIPPQEIIVVVDHNPSLLEQVRANLPDVLAIENSGIKGLSGARNTGIEVAKSRLIAFFDDDEVLDPQCLSKLSHWFEQPQVVGAGGRIIPNWLSPRPSWFPEEFGWVLGYSYKGLPTGPAPVRNLIGGSMCFHRSVLDQVGGFRDGIGRINKTPLGCEETELCIRILQQGPEARLIYEPEAVVHHRTPPERATWNYFRKRCFYEGISKAVISQYVGANDSLSSERLYTARVLPRGILKGIGDFLFHHDKSGLARAGAILVGLFFTAAGFVYGAFSLRQKQFKSNLEKTELKGTI